MFVVYVVKLKTHDHLFTFVYKDKFMLVLRISKHYPYSCNKCEYYICNRFWFVVSLKEYLKLVPIASSSSIGNIFIVILATTIIIIVMIMIATTTNDWVWFVDAGSKQRLPSMLQAWSAVIIEAIIIGQEGCQQF